MTKPSNLGHVCVLGHWIVGVRQFPSQVFPSQTYQELLHVLSYAWISYGSSATCALSCLELFQFFSNNVTNHLIHCFDHLLFVIFITLCKFFSKFCCVVSRASLNCVSQASNHGRSNLLDVLGVNSSSIARPY